MDEQKERFVCGTHVWHEVFLVRLVSNR